LYIKSRIWLEGNTTTKNWVKLHFNISEVVKYIFPFYVLRVTFTRMCTCFRAVGSITNRRNTQTKPILSRKCGMLPLTGYAYSAEGGASSNECDETYAGTGPFSTVETASLSATITQLNPDVYFCLHSYSQLLMIPFGHRQETADNYDELVC